jgi:hypothetical protein
LLENGDKETEIVYGEEKTFYTGLTREARQAKNLLYRHEEPNESTNEGSLSFVLFESPFTTVSTVSRGHLSLFSLVPIVSVIYQYKFLVAQCVKGLLPR